MDKEIFEKKEKKKEFERIKIKPIEGTTQYISLELGEIKKRKKEESE